MGEVEAEGCSERWKKRKKKKDLQKSNKAEGRNDERMADRDKGS